MFSQARLWKQAGWSLVAVLIAHFSYRALVAPLLIPARPDNELSVEAWQHGGARRAVDTIRNHLASLLPAGSWELEDPELLQSDDLTLLMNDYRELEDGRLEVRPITLIYYPGGRRNWNPDTSPAPFVIRASEGAVLRFDEPIDLRRAKMGRPVRGELVGTVHIARPATSTSPERLDLYTSNLQIDAQKIWSPQQVEFQYGESYGRGRDLIVTLEDISGDQSQPWSAVRSVELVHLDQLHLAGKWAAGLGPPSDTAIVESAATEAGTTEQNPAEAAAANRSESALPPIQVRCAGSLRIDNHLEMMTLEEQVEIVRQWTSQLADRAECDRLELHFTLDRSAGGSSQTGGAFTVQPGRVLAVGNPVRVELQSRGWYIESQQIDYQPDDKKVSLKSDVAALIRTPEHQVTARQVSYTPNADGSWGTLFADGPGEYQGMSGEQPVRAQWEGTLSTQPRGDVYRVTVVGKTRLDWGDARHLSARAIEALCLTSSTSRSSSASPSTLPGRHSPVESLQLKSLVAREEVDFQLNQLSGSTSLLEVEIAELSAADLHKPGRGDGLAKDAVLPPPAVASADTKSSTELSTDPFGFGSSGPLTVDGHQIHLRLNRQDDQLQLQQALVHGQVHAVQMGREDAGQSEQIQWEVAGDRVQVQLDAEGSYHGSLSGSPASLSGRQSRLVAEHLELDQQQNRIRVPGRGELWMPLSDMAGSAGGSPAARSVAQIQWLDGLDFDGNQAQISGDVWVQTDEQRIHMDLLQAQLATGISLRDPPHADSSVEVRWIFGRGVVTGDSRTRSADGTLGWERFLGREFQLDQQSGDFRADGPGWVVSVRPGSGIGPGPLAAANDSGHSAHDPPRLRYLRIDFESELVGNLRHHNAEFRGNVRGLTGPVDRWESTIQAEDPSQLPSGGAMMRCEALSIAQLPSALGPVPQWGIVASVSAAVATPKLVALGDRVSYDQQKDLLVLEGNGRRSATLLQRRSDSPQQSRMAARKIFVWPNSGRIEAEDVEFDVSDRSRAATQR